MSTNKTTILEHNERLSTLVKTVDNLPDAPKGELTITENGTHDVKAYESVAVNVVGSDEFWDVYQQNGKRTDYINAFAGVGWNASTFRPKYPMAPVGAAAAEGMFSSFNNTGAGDTDDLVDFTPFLPLLDFSGATQFRNTFSGARIKNLYVDAGNATYLSGTFSAGSDSSGYIENLTLRLTEKATTLSGILNYQTRMKTLRFTDDSSIGANIGVAHLDALEKESIISIINALSSTKTGKTATLSVDAVNREFQIAPGANDGTLSAEWAALVASKPNWTIKTA